MRRDDRGAAIIELALVAPVLAVMVVGVVDMSNAFGRKLALEQGAQRAIEKVMQTTGDDTVEATIKTEVVCQINGTNDDGSCKSTPITAADNVTVTYRLECTDSAGAMTSSETENADTFDSTECPAGTTTEARYLQVTVTDYIRRCFRYIFRVRTRTGAILSLPPRGCAPNEDSGGSRSATRKALPRSRWRSSLPILVLMIWMFVQLAQVYRAMSGIQHALGEGARYATLCLDPTSSGCDTPTPEDIAATINASVYGIGPGTFDVPSPVKETSGTSSYYDLKVSYSQPTNMLLFPGPTINVSRSKRVWVAAYLS